MTRAPEAHDAWAVEAQPNSRLNAVRFITEVGFWPLADILARAKVRARVETKPSYGGAMGYAVNDGVRIHYEVLGDGPPLLLQHGFTQSINDWITYGYVASLVSHFRLILVDARGHGRSDKPHEASAYAHSQYVNDVVAVLDDCGIGSAHYWGYSMGGWIGLGMITLASERVLKAVIGGSHPYERKLPESLPDGSDPLRFSRAFYKMIGDDFDTLSNQKQKELLASDTLAWAASLNHRVSSEGLLPSVATACLMYAGQEDGVFAQAQKGAALIPNCRFVTVPGKHAPAFRNSAAILPHVLEFLGAARETL